MACTNVSKNDDWMQWRDGNDDGMRDTLNTWRDTRGKKNKIVKKNLSGRMCLGKVNIDLARWSHTLFLGKI